MSPSSEPARSAHPLLHLTFWVAFLAIGQVVAEPIPVRTVDLVQVLEVPVYSAPAAVVARNAPQLAAEIDARVTELPATVGEKVSAGALLALLDCRRYRSTLAAARAELARAEAGQRFAGAQLARARNLERNKSISEELLDQRRTDLATAEAENTVRAEAVRRAQIDAESCELRAPFDAVVTARLVSVGSYVTRGTPLLGLLETAGQEVSVALRHDQAADMQRAASLTFDSNGDRHPVRLRALLPLLDSVARTREARLSFAGAGALPGTAGRLEWRGDRALLPADYLVRRAGQLGVLVLDGDNARFVALPDAQDGRPTPVALPPSTRLITDGRQRLNDGDAVLVIPPGATPE